MITMPTTATLARAVHHGRSTRRPRSGHRRAVAKRLGAKIVLSPLAPPGSVEQYRRLAATLHHAQAQTGMKIVMVASAMPGEGKTLTATNLALTLSESYRRKVLHHRRRSAPADDAPDLRRPEHRGAERGADRTRDVLPSGVRAVAAPDAAAGRPAQPRSDRAS